MLFTNCICGRNGIGFFRNPAQKCISASEMKNAIGNMGSDTQIDSNMLALIYYEYYKEGEIGNIYLDDFIQFLQKDIMTNEKLSSEFDENIKDRYNGFHYFQVLKS